MPYCQLIRIFSEFHMFVLRYCSSTPYDFFFHWNSGLSSWNMVPSVLFLIFPWNSVFLLPKIWFLSVLFPNFLLEFWLILFLKYGSSVLIPLKFQTLLMVWNSIKILKQFLIPLWKGAYLFWNSPLFFKLCLTETEKLNSFKQITLL